MQTIPIIIEEAERGELEEETLGVLRSGGERFRLKVKEIDAEKLRISLKILAEQISGFMNDVKEVGQFQLEEVELQVQVTGEGKIALIASTKVGGTIKLKFKKPEKRKKCKK